MKIAVVGTGISGLVASYLLSNEHDLTVFEANDYIGGHTHTASVEVEGASYEVDMGFIVFNERNYPNFIKLLKHLDVASQPSDMSFSVSSEKTGLEYRGSSLNTLFAQRKNLFRPWFHRMILEILRFGRESRKLLDEEASRITVGEYLEQGKYSPQFAEHYIVPMGSAIWSANPDMMMQFPARFFVQFFKNHGFLGTTRDMPIWRTVRGGSRRYVDPITEPFRDRIRLNCPVRRIRRSGDGVEVQHAGGDVERFDRVVIATHSDQALRLLSDPSDAETEILGSIGYQDNEVVLHTDESLLPREKRAWASWNYTVPLEPRDRVAVTYNMNMLQSIESTRTFCVSLNLTETIDPDKILRRAVFDHPVYTFATIDAQKRRHEISGVNNTYYCGAYWGFGFHEDGVKSGLAVAEHFGKGLSS
jgi:predicted NAD/FAD-binding protein